jgi:hypothetical protein
LRRTTSTIRCGICPISSTTARLDHAIVEQHWRNRYYRLARPEVAEVLERVSSFTPDQYR